MYACASLRSQAEAPNGVFIEVNPHAGMPPGQVPLQAVIWMTVAMALVPTLSFLAFYYFSGRFTKSLLDVANAAAGGVMLVASCGLLADSADSGVASLAIGVAVGAAVMKISQAHLQRLQTSSSQQLKSPDGRKVTLFMAAMAIHGMGEGGGVGASFAGDTGWTKGPWVTLVVGLHNVPEGIALAALLAANGTSPQRTVLWTLLTALPQALAAPPAYMFVDAFRTMLPVATGFAAGSMMWVVLAELLPEALEEQKGVPAFLRNTLAACAVLTKRAGCTAACSS